MNRTDRYIATGALAISVGLLAAPAAGAVPDDSGTNKAQVEYRELLTLVDPSAPSSQLTKARVDHLERLAMADEQGVPDSDINKALVEHGEMLQDAGQTGPDWSKNKSYIEYKERLALAEAGESAPAPSDAGDSSTPVSVWQLALSALAGALLGGGAVAASRTRRTKAPDSEPEHQETVSV